MDDVKECLINVGPLLDGLTIRRRSKKLSERRTLPVTGPQDHRQDSRLAHLVARRLMVRAASRMRRMGYWAAEASASTRFVCGGGWGERMAMPLTQDSFTMTRAIDAMWQKLVACHGRRPIKQVSVVLSKLTREGDITLDLFDPLPGLEAKRHRKRILLSHSLDGLSRRYGRDTVTYGIQPPIEAEFISTKIAFTRIPEREEFYE